MSPDRVILHFSVPNCNMFPNVCKHDKSQVDLHVLCRLQHVRSFRVRNQIRVFGWERESARLPLTGGNIIVMVFADLSKQKHHVNKCH